MDCGVRSPNPLTLPSIKRHRFGFGLNPFIPRGKLALHSSPSLPTQEANQKRERGTRRRLEGELGHQNRRQSNQIRLLPGGGIHEA